MRNFKLLFARLILTIMLSCSLIPNAPFQVEDSSQTVIPVHAAAYNRATIKKVQKKLNKRGYNCGTPDGIIGTKTKQAIKKYQKDKDLKATGTVNSKLLKSLGVKPVKDSPSSIGSSSVGSSNTNGETVYITDTGSKYHRSGCRYLSRSQHAISKSDAQSQGYDACSVCSP